MANYWGRSGAPMIQPTKDQFRYWLSEAREELKEERRARQVTEYKLRIATQKFGELVLEGKLAIPTERLGELVLRIAMENADGRVGHETEKLLIEG
jgi:hypothetical protein